MEGHHPAGAVHHRLSELIADPKVRQLHLPPAIDEQIGGLDISMQDTAIAVQML